MSKNSQVNPEDILKQNLTKPSRSRNIIQEMIKSPELRGLEDEERQYVIYLLNKLDVTGLEELQSMVRDRLETLRADLQALQEEAISG